jgi:predicted RNA binding protein YcfA (HicA-like mRNA interferase family)
MPKLPRVNAREMVQALLRAGFYEDHQEGSHLALYNPTTNRWVTVPRHPGDLGPRLTHKILVQAGLSPEQFRGLLK